MTKIVELILRVLFNSKGLLWRLPDRKHHGIRPKGGVCSQLSRWCSDQPLLHENTGSIRGREGLPRRKKNIK